MASDDAAQPTCQMSIHGDFFMLPFLTLSADRM